MQTDVSSDRELIKQFLLIHKRKRHFKSLVRLAGGTFALSCDT